jgi:RNA polymerase sigma factor (sigma-70 family)
VAETTTGILCNLIDRLTAGDQTARHDLIMRAYFRLEKLILLQMRNYKRLEAHMESGEVRNDVIARSMKAIDEVRFDSVCRYIRFLSMLIKRELVDRVRKIYGPRGEGANRAPAINRDNPSTFHEANVDPADKSDLNPARQAEVHELYDKMNALPEELRDVVDHLYFAELTQEEAAQSLGISRSEVHRRWVRARSKLSDWLPRPGQDGN